MELLLLYMYMGLCESKEVHDVYMKKKYNAVRHFFALKGIHNRT